METERISRRPTSAVVTGAIRMFFAPLLQLPRRANDGQTSRDGNRTESNELSRGWKLFQVLMMAAIPIAVAVGTGYLSMVQREIQQAERKADLELKIVEIFLRELGTSDPSRRRVAFALLKEILAKQQSELLPQFWRVAAEVDAVASINVANELAADASQNGQARSEAERTRYDISSQFTIKRPENMAGVGRVEPVEAQTPYVSLHHYVVVTADETGVSYLERELTVRPGGTMNGSAQFGSADVGIGETFTLEILATVRQDQELRDQWPTRPDDALWSNAIRVRRTRQ